MARMRRDDAQLTKKRLICLTVEQLPLRPMNRTFTCKLLAVLRLIITNDIDQSEVLLGQRACGVLPDLLVKWALN